MSRGKATHGYGIAAQRHRKATARHNAAGNGKAERCNAMRWQSMALHRQGAVRRAQAKQG